MIVDNAIFIFNRCIKLLLYNFNLHIFARKKLVTLETD